MAATKTAKPTSLSLNFITSTVDGVNTYLSRTYNNLKPDATDDNVFSAAVALSALTSYTLNTVTRTDKGELTEAV